MDNPSCVFVIDDEPDIRDLVCEHLLAAGFQVFAFDHGEAALDAARAGLVPDLLILDICLPGVSGVELRARLHALTSTAEVPILFVSAAPQLAPVGHEVVPKPFDPAFLLERAKRLCARRELPRVLRTAG